jgi:hypothetical protein
MWSRVFVVGLALAMAAPAWGQERAADDPDRFSPAEMRRGPSWRETGRIGDMTPAPVPPAASAVQRVPDVGDSGERSVDKAAAAVNVPRAERVGTINPATLEREVGERLATLDDCRIEVARRHQVPPADVRADTLTLRWTIRPNGAAGATEVVATAPVELEVMDCVKATMSTWTFSRPRGGPVPVERDFRFRPVP